MEKYIKYRHHDEDDFARLLVKAFRAQGIYDKNKHDTIIMAIAPMFVRLEQARDAIADHGVLLEETTREDNTHFVRNPACDLEAIYVDRIRKALHDVGMYVEAVPKKNISGTASDEDSDPLSTLGRMIGSISRKDYHKGA